jgi:ArsR family transcriptional regulator
MHTLSVQAHSVFQALSDPLRIRIMRLIADSKNEACLCEIALSLNEPEYKLSRHLKVLRQAGLLEAEKQGRWIYHRIVSGKSPLGGLYKYLQTLPDADSTFSADLYRFKKQMPYRDNDGRCRSGCLTQETKSASRAGRK